MALAAQLWAVSPQTVEQNQLLVARRDIPFPILADPDQLVIREWGIYNDDDPKGRAIPHPATYVIATDGHIHWSYVGISTRDRPAPKDILDQLKGLLE